MKKDKKEKIKKPNGILYFLVYILFYPFLKAVFRLKVDRRAYRPPDGPYILLSNHQSFMDFLLPTLATYPRTVNAVAARKFFYYKPLGTLLPLMGCIPKNLFEPDMRSIMGIISVIRRGGRVLIFPEGRCSTDGEYMGMHVSIAKLIKKLNVPVITCRIDGSYTCMPLWRKGFRPGRVRVTLANLFTAEDTQTLDAGEINTRIDARLSGAGTRASGAEDTPPVSGTEPPRVFKARRLAEGLENILYYCPGCGGEFTLETGGNAIRCGSCGYSAELGADGHFIYPRGDAVIPQPADVMRGAAKPSTIFKWFSLQVAYEKRRLQAEAAPAAIRVIVRMHLNKDKGLEECGEGDLWADRDGWHYEGKLNGAGSSLTFPIDTVPALPFDPNDNFQIYSKGKFYVFTPKGRPDACVKYVIIGECIYWRYASDIQMTYGRARGF